MKLITLSLLALVAQAKNTSLNLQTGCPIGWSSHGDFCYLHSGDKAVPWTSIAGECYKLTPCAQPVSVHDTATTAFLTSLAGDHSNSWIGLFRDQYAPDDWFWIDASDLDYTNWTGGEPVDGRNCGEFNSAQSGVWFSHPCSDAFPFFCQASPDSGNSQPANPDSGNHHSGIKTN